MGWPNVCRLMGHATWARACERGRLARLLLVACLLVGNVWPGVSLAETLRDLHFAGVEAINNGQPDVALRAFETGIEMAVSQGLRRHTGLFADNLATVYSQLAESQPLFGDEIALAGNPSRTTLEKAVAYRRLALEVYREFGDRAAEARCLQDIGINLDALKRHDEAIAALERALLIHRGIDDAEEIFLDFSSLASAYSGSGRLDEAIDYHRRALHLARRLGRVDGEMVSLVGLSDLLARRGDFEEALALGREALRSARTNGNRSLQAVIMTNLARVLGSLERWDEALVLLDRAESSLRDDRSPEMLLPLLLLRGETLAEMGREAQAGEQWRQALDLARATGGAGPEGEALLHLGELAVNQGKQHAAKRRYQAALRKFVRVGDLRAEAATRVRIAAIESDQGRLWQALKSAREALAIQQRLDDQRELAVTLLTIAGIEEQSHRYQEALAALDRALTIARKLQFGTLQADILNRRGSVHTGMRDYDQAMRRFREALQLLQRQGDQRGEAVALDGMGRVYAAGGRLALALEHFRAALVINRGRGDTLRQGNNLGNIGVALMDHHRFDEAEIAFREAAALQRAASSPLQLSQSLANLGRLFIAQGRFDRALKQLRDAIEEIKAIDLPLPRADALSAIGALYIDLGRTGEASNALRRALEIYRDYGSTIGESNVLHNIASVQMQQGRFDQALITLDTTLRLAQALGDPIRQAETLTSRALVNALIGLGNRADELYEQALALGANDPDIVATVLCNQERLRADEQDWAAAIALGRRCVEAQRQLGARDAEATVLTNLGSNHLHQGSLDQADALFEQALRIQRENADRSGEANTLRKFGVLRVEQQRFDQAFSMLCRALAISMAADRSGSARVGWTEITGLLSAEGHPSAAILIGKLAVNQLQAIRDSNRGLSEYQRLGLMSRSRAIYRDLARLLLEAGRVAEAQQVMALLKRAEYYAYIRVAGSDGATAKMLALTLSEAGWYREFEAIVSEIDELQVEVQALDVIHPDARTPPEQRRHARSMIAVDALSDRLCQVIGSLREGRLELPAAVLEASLGDPHQRHLVASLSTRVAAPVALLRYLVTDERTFIVLTVAGASLVEVVDVSADTLDGEVSELLRRLVDRSSPAQPAARRLYDRLIAPVADELIRHRVRYLLIQPDRRLGYIPFAALHDGNGWLVERYATAIYAGDTERAGSGTTEQSVAAFGASQFAVTGDESASGCKLVVGGLPSVRDELEGIVRQTASDPDGVLPGKVFLNQAFSRQAFFDGASRGHTLLHVASHFVLDPGSAAASCLQLGDGRTLSLREIRAAELDLRHLDLVTLSSCNTGLPGVDGEGLEIEALATVFLRQGARAVIASLWSVADASTAMLMQSLYGHLSRDSELEKAEALRQAQLALLSGRHTAPANDPARGIYPASNTGSRPVDYSDAFFWAPFVLVGN